MKKIDDFLNSITMYRLVLYLLIFFVALATVFSLTGHLPYDPYALLFSVAFLVFVGVVTNFVFAKIFKTPTNVESVYISALILALIVPPLRSFHDLPFLFWAAAWTMASKFIFAIGKKHIFNPVAIAVVITSVALGRPANWWIGNLPMLPFVLAGGLLIVRKLRRSDLFLIFLTTALGTSVLLGLVNGSDLFTLLKEEIIYSPLFFFATVMLTEPLTTPPTKKPQIIYGGLVGLLFSPQIHLGSLYTTPEIALIVGNVFSYLVSPKEKLLLTLKEKIQVAPDIYDFLFTPTQQFSFTPGQYMEWTLEHPHPDSRGNRRYFTLASSPTEKDIRIGVKLAPNPSSYKKSLLSLDNRTPIVASSLSGDFTLPKNPDQKLVFIAGGIGITPYRSMLKYLLDTNQRRQITLIYSVSHPSEIVYQDVLSQAQSQLGTKLIYTLTDKSAVPNGWVGKVGYIDDQLIRSEISDLAHSFFYISGSHSLVTAVKDVLKNLGVRSQMIKTDYFPGFA